MKRYLVLVFFLNFIFFGRSQNFQWAKSIGGVNQDAANSVALDAAGNVYVTGYFQGTVDFDPGAGVQNAVSTSSYNPDAFILKLDAQGNFLWVKQVGGGFPDQGSSIALDGSGNILILGVYTGTVDFDPGPGTYIMANPVFNQNNMFVLKLDPSGNFLWVKQCFGNASVGLENKVLFDANNNIYFSGGFTSAVDFDPGPSSFVMSSAGNSDIFLAKWDANGNFIWARQWGNTSYYGETLRSMSLDGSANVYIVSDFADSLDLDPTAGVQIATTNTFNTKYTYVCKLNSSGSFVWAKVLNGNFNYLINNYDVGYSCVHANQSGDVYLAGAFQGTIDCDPGPSVNTVISSVSSGFVIKLDAQGNFTWFKQFIGMNLYANSYKMCGDNNGDIYLSGGFPGTVDFDPGVGIYNLTSYGAYDVFVCRLDPSGNFVWAAQLGGALSDSNYGSALDGSGNIYMVGAYNSTCDFDPGSSTFNLTSNGVADIYVQKMSTAVYVGIDETKPPKAGIHIWPNPAAGNVSIQAPVNTLFSIQSVSGQTLKEGFLNESSYVELSDLPAGIYFVTCRVDRQNYTEKLIILTH